ncbi:MAG: 2-dehydro-3-deoxy-D-gluconate 5-dehydrogenase KduD [Chloroflexi bacterium]|nr:MAG: 2-dehydro-3-deoxy-D-gluconate 5-dehydrogenase KduD [Chloroflexota bacterium]
MELFSLEGCTALVTGVNRGIGLALAEALAEAGADIIGLYRTDCRAAEKAVTRYGRRFHALQCNLEQTPVEGLSEAVRQAVNLGGRLDIVVNNAGIIRRSPAVEHSETDWDAVLQVNLKAVFFLTQAAARVMKEQGRGKIINIASMLSFQGGILVPSYTASKHGVVGITRALANEWAACGINVNAIAPGYIATDNTAPLRADPVRNRSILERIPAGRWGTPADLKGAVVFLASPASDYVNGAVIPVDGGWLSR